MAAYREGNSLAPKKRPGSKPKLNEGARKLLEVDLEKRPAATLPQRREFLRWVCRVKVNGSTVSGFSIMGASPDQEAELTRLESVDLLPKFAQEAHLFLQGLDCFFYQTKEHWAEPSGRVITEAMVCAFPVVCHKYGGYVEIIDHGQNGFLFETQQEALEILLRLKEDRALRGSIGRAARETVEELFSPARRAQIVEFYLR